MVSDTISTTTTKPLSLSHAVCSIMSYLPYLCLSLSHAVCSRAHVLFTLFVFACVKWYPTHIVLCFCFVFLRLVVSFSELSMFECPFGILVYLQTKIR